MRSYPFLIASIIPAVAFGQTTASSNTVRPITFLDRQLQREVGSPTPSPDGKWLLYTHADKKRDLYLLNLDGEPRPKPVLSGAQYWSEAGRFSPDGRYFAFVSNEAGPFEVYVASVQNPAKRWKVSREGRKRPLPTASSKMRTGS